MPCCPLAHTPACPSPTSALLCLPGLLFLLCLQAFDLVGLREVACKIHQLNNQASAPPCLHNYIGAAAGWLPLPTCLPALPCLHIGTAAGWLALPACWPPGRPSWGLPAVAALQPCRCAAALTSGCASFFLFSITPPSFFPPCSGQR